MKYSFTKILFFLILLISFSSCKKEKTEDYVDEPQTISKNDVKKDSVKVQEKKSQTDNKVYEEKPVANITPVEANNYVGKPVVLKGLIVEVTKREKVAYLNLTEKYPENPCAAVIFADKFEEFSDMNELVHKNVQITGRVSTFKGKPQIILSNRSQLKILN
jgi:hypothetical protein